MKKIGFILSIIVLSFALFAGSAMAQNIRGIRADIPFDFNLAGKDYAAGKYSVDVTADNGTSAVLTLRDDRHHILQRVFGRRSHRGKDHQALAFDSLNGQRVLSILELGDRGYDFPVSGRKLPAAAMNRVTSTSITETN